jgi:orotidine-5'-phosphate decarboxylase
MNFADRLDAALQAVNHPCVLGVDPHLEHLPAEFAVARDARAPRSERAAAVERFCHQLLELAAGRVAAVKPQSAFFELLGADGVRAWESTILRARALGLIVIGDVKRGDVASTAEAYARAHLEGPAPCDALTVNPYLGEDALEPFLEVADHARGGLFVLVRTSNPGAGLWQGHGTPPLAERVAESLARLGRSRLGACGFSSLGAVVGATHPRELARMRALLPQALLLLPGYGAQGASAADVVEAFPCESPRWRGALVNSSRGIAFAWQKRPGVAWQDAARDALDAMIADVRTALGIGGRAR